MSENRPTIRTAPIVAVILGVAALVLGPVAPAFQPIALILAIASVIVGGAAAYNHRQDRTNLVAASVAAAVGLIALIVVLVSIAS